jgi:hypothetical protein
VNSRNSAPGRQRVRCGLSKQQMQPTNNMTIETEEKTITIEVAEADLLGLLHGVSLYLDQEYSEVGRITAGQQGIDFMQRKFSVASHVKIDFLQDLRARLLHAREDLG